MERKREGNGVEGGWEGGEVTERKNHERNREGEGREKRRRRRRW